MSLKEQLLSDALSMLNSDELALEAIYHKKDGIDVSLNCLLDSLSSNNMLRGNKEVEDMLLAHVHIDFTPEIYEEFTVDGETYKIMKYDKNDLFTSLHLSKDKRPTGKNYGFRS